MNDPQSSPAFVKSAARTVELVELVAHAQQGLTFGEITTSLQLPKSSAHNILATLVHLGWLRQDEVTRRYEIGLRAWLAGQAYLDRLDLSKVAKPHLEAIVSEVNETVQLGILEDVTVIYVAKLDGSQPLRLVSHVGARLPAYATGIGKVLLGALDDDELERRMAKVDMQRFTDSTITSFSDLKSALEEVRSNGWASDRGEYTAGVVCVAVPVRDHTGKVAAGLSCTVPRARIEAGDEALTSIREILTTRANLISKELGWAGGQGP